MKIAESDQKRDQNLLIGEAISRQAVEQQRAWVEQIKCAVMPADAAAPSSAVRF